MAATKWESATITTLDARIPGYIRKIAKRNPFSGRVVTGGIVTVKDSSWLLSWTANQPHFKHQPCDQVVVWVYSLFVEKDGDY
nr:oleate hydratase [Bradyrhizobium sp. AC87j1]